MKYVLKARCVEAGFSPNRLLSVSKMAYSHQYCLSVCRKSEKCVKKCRIVCICRGKLVVLQSGKKALMTNYYLNNKTFMKKIAIIVCFIGLVVMDGSVEAQGLFGGRKRNKARIERAAKKKTGTLPIMVKGEKFEMVLVRGGSYMMGCDPEF